MKNYKKLVVALFLFFSLAFVIANSESCQETSTTKECTNIISGKKSLEIFKPRILEDGKYKDFHYGLNDGIFRDYKGAIYRENGGYFSVYSIQDEYLHSFAFSITGNYNSQSYMVSSMDFNWTWNMNHDIHTDEYIFLGYNNNPSFNWTQKFHFYPDKKVKIYHYLSNNLPKNIEDTKFWYINTIDDSGYLKYNNQKYEFNKNINKEGNFNDILPKVEFNNNYIFDYSDLINEGFDITNFYMGSGSAIGFPSIDIMAIGVTKNSGIFPSGSSVVLDPSLEVSTNISMGGNLVYDTVIIHHNSILSVNATKFINITANNYIHVYGTINGNGLGESGGSGFSANNNGGSGSGGSGSGPGSGGSGSGSPGIEGYGGGGAGHVSTGGSGGGSGGGGGSSYGDNLLDTSFIGSGGGGGGAGTSVSLDATGGSGGGGGAGISLIAPTIFINGTVQSSGSSGGIGSINAGASTAGGGGGGSAGTIFIKGTNVNISNSNFILNGASGGKGACRNAGNTGSGGGGSGGRFKLFYSENLYNDSITISVSAGDSGGAPDLDSCTSSGSGSNGGAGSIYYNQSSDLGLNQRPTLDSNETFPNADLNTSNIVINISTSDSDNDDIFAAYFTLNYPNGTSVFSNTNGTHISGDSKTGESEIWHSPQFNITNTTSELGEWNWTVLIQSNGSNANNTFSESFTITDNSNPSVNLISLENNQVWNRNVSIPINFISSDNVEVDSCWYSLDEGITNITISSCSNSTFSANQNSYNFTLWVNDTSNNINKTFISNISLNQDLVSPFIQIISPNGSLSSKTFTVQINGTDVGGINYCQYNITRGASTEISNTNLTLNDSTGYWEDGITVSSDADYIINSICYDYNSFSNKTNNSFSVDTVVISPPSGGGGGGTVIIEGEQGWSMEASEGVGNFEIEMTKDSQRTLNILFENLGDSSRTITLTCEDIEGDICNYVEFETNPFNLELLTDTKQVIKFTINIPSDIENGDYQLNIIGTDDLNRQGAITVFLGIGTSGLISQFFTRIVSSTSNGIPYFLIFFPLFLLSILGFARLYRKVEFRTLFTIGSSLFISTLAVFIF